MEARSRRGFLASQGLGGLFAMFACGSFAAFGGRGDESLDRVKSEVQAKDAVLVDVREKREWDRGHLKGAVLLPLSTLSVWERDGLKDEDRAWIEKNLPAGKPIYCHCLAGGRAASAGEILGKLGRKAKPLKSSYRELLKAGFPEAAK